MVQFALSQGQERYITCVTPRYMHRLIQRGILIHESQEDRYQSCVRLHDSLMKDSGHEAPCILRDESLVAHLL